MEQARVSNSLGAVPRTIHSSPASAEVYKQCTTSVQRAYGSTGTVPFFSHDAVCR